MGRVLSELARPEIFVHPGSDGPESLQFQTSTARTPITLRHMLCHTSGLSYDLFNPKLLAWRESRQEPCLTLTGQAKKAHTVPLMFEPDQGWMYSGGVDVSSH